MLNIAENTKSNLGNLKRDAIKETQIKLCNVRHYILRFNE
jgi:hypothetical protein